jgi:two-component system response regulator
MTTPTPKTVLIIDDSHADARLMELWLRNSAVVTNVHSVRSGREALQFLRRQDPFAQAPLPHILLLDIHLPDMLGWDLLSELRQDEQLARIPVVVLTGTVHEADARRARDYGAARYLCKPFDAEEYAALVQEIDRVAQDLH